MVKKMIQVVICPGLHPTVGGVVINGMKLSGKHYIEHNNL